MTDDRIKELRYEAGCHGDYEQVAICDRALEGDEAAIAECVRVTDAAADQISKVLEPRGYRVRKQMEAVEKIGLTDDDVRDLARRLPERYTDLLIATGSSYRKT